MIFRFTIIFILCEYATSCSHYEDPACVNITAIDGNYFSNRWIVEVDGDENTAQQIAKIVGFKDVEPIENYDDYYFFCHPQVKEKHKMKHPELTDILQSNTQVRSVDQQYVWQPTIQELENYPDVVGHETPKKVTVSSFDPDSKKSQQNLTFRPVDNFSVAAEFDHSHDNIEMFPPLQSIIDLDKFYESAEKDPSEK